MDRRLSLALLLVGLALAAGCPLEVRVRCGGPADCAAGERCSDGSCVAAGGAQGGSGGSGGTGGSGHGGTGGSGPIARVIGSGCGSDADCEPGLACDTELTGGYCLTSCGRQGACPPDGVCITQFGVSICLRGCDTGADCGRSGYGCQPAPGGEYVCGPLGGGGGSGGGGSGGSGGSGPEQKIGQPCVNVFDCVFPESCEQDAAGVSHCERFCSPGCPAGFRCAADNWCVPEGGCPPAVASGAACDASYDCPACNDCDFGSCAVPCGSDLDCPAGLTCDTFDHFCR